MGALGVPVSPNLGVFFGMSFLGIVFLHILGEILSGIGPRRGSGVVADNPSSMGWIPPMFR